MFAGLLYTAAASASLVESDIKVEVSILAAFLASIGSCITSHPGDVVLTATYQQSSSHNGNDNNNDNLASVVSTIYKRGGIHAFFTGLSARFLHVGIIITSQLVLYDFIKQLLGLPATGSH
jgi:solute carrier family 25 phosphate transporter 3|uniref:ADP,ATP carrier protein n=1 Tax=Attheya septentrionalis TaxID=420275 RepID=A0A7S2UJZ9_9STRA|mmetsp:Transcript_25814/g.46719  ORF Transcript_25814/g.46719 Transcript_25814/m.46719 type:complete len:121 (+) Transcript_25814:227-589(+)